MQRFLVIDDSKLARQKQAQSITEAGYEVVGEAVDGQNGLELYKDLKPDFVTMDLEMPVMNGLETTKKIIEFDPEAKVIIVSSVMNKALITEVLNAGAIFHLKKPFKSELLQRNLVRIISRSQNDK